MLGNRLPLPGSGGLILVAIAVLVTSVACSTTPPPSPAVSAGPLGSTAAYDVILRNGTVYDGLGGPAWRADLGITGDRLAAIGDLAGHTARVDLDVAGLAVAPGFINMLSWADESLLVDGRSLSDLHQGVTLEVFGEGWSMGPLNDAMRQRLLARQTELRYDVPWSTLGEYLEHLEARGVSTNVASFVGATTVRQYVLGFEDRDPSAAELERMRDLVREGMREGAMGLGTSLPYIPAAFAETDEIVALAAAAAEFDGLYISHIRDEGSRLLESIDEFLEIVRRAGIRGEVYHLKASGKKNWQKMEEAIARLEAARTAGLAVTADIYPYPASSTGLTYALPAWVQEGGHEAMVARLRDLTQRPRILAELDLIPPEDLVLTSFRNPDLRHWTGKTLAEVSAARGTAPDITALELIIEDDSRIGTVRFTQSEDNVRRALLQPWVSLGSDGASLAPEPPFTNAQPHPRAYGTFARVLGKYARDEQLLSLEDAIRKMTSLPASNLRLAHRGRLAPGYFADIVVFDPKTIQENATFEKPHQLATGMHHVLVNGQFALRNGTHTGARPGRFIKGPGAAKPDQRPASAGGTERRAPAVARSEASTHAGNRSVTGPARGKNEDERPRLEDAAQLLDLWVREQLEYHEIPGVAIGVVRDDQLVWSGGWGKSDLQTGAPVTASTLFRIGSVSKLFTATAILQLRDRGLLALDDPVKLHLPWFRVGNPFADSPEITVRHLLTHTSGLPREGAFPYWTTHVFPTSEALRAALPSQTMVHRPGETYKYSNLGISVLGEILVAKSGQSFSDLLHDQLLEPLGMTSTTAAPTPAEIARLARAYQRKRPNSERALMDYYDSGAIAPAAAVVTTVEDLARFLGFHVSAHRPAALAKDHDDASGLLAATTRREMHRAQFTYPSWTGGRGLGFAVSRRDARTYVSHGGWIGGHRADFVFDPARRIGAVAITNADDASPSLFSRQALEVFADAFERDAAQHRTPPTASLPPAHWQNYRGRFTDPWGWEVEVAILAGQLVLYEHSYPPADDTDESITRLTPVAGSETRFLMSDGEEVEFELEASGEVRRIRKRYEYFEPVRVDRARSN